jgi:hypothetical protein
MRAVHTMRVKAIYEYIISNLHSSIDLVNRPAARIDHMSAGLVEVESEFRVACNTKTSTSSNCCSHDFRSARARSPLCRLVRWTRATGVHLKVGLGSIYKINGHTHPAAFENNGERSAQSFVKHTHSYLKDGNNMHGKEEMRKWQDNKGM